MDVEAWKSFEDRVTRVYQSLGYQVTINSSKSGQQVDLTAERVFAGAGVAKLYVECKYRSKRPVSNQEVQDFQSTYSSVRLSHGFTLGVLVTNSSFSKDARQVADAITPAGPIKLFTLDELEGEILNLSYALHSFVEDYESEPIAASYVRLDAVGKVPYGTKVKIQNVEAAILEWIDSGKPGFLSILADFGAGKTTLLRRIKYELCRKKVRAGVSDGRTPVPLFFALKELSEYNGLDDYISSILQRELGKQVPLSVFWRFLETGMLVILLDGFDEISAKIDKRGREEALNIISPLIARNLRATILTCRPGFFVSASEHNNLVTSIERARSYPLLATSRPEDEANQTALRELETLNRKIYRHFVEHGRSVELAEDASTKIELVGLSDEQVERFLKPYDSKFRASTGYDWQGIRNFLAEIYDLNDLMRRPLLLEMIVQTIIHSGAVVKRGSSGAHQLNAASIYEIYTSTQLAKEATEKRRTLLSDDQRRRFAETLACTMLLSDAVRGVSYQMLLHEVQKASEADGLEEVLKRASTEQIATDVQLCSFLTRNVDDEFVFVHRSFMEFFVARHLRAALDSEGDLSLMSLQLSPAVLYFLGSFLALDDRLRTRLYGLIASGQSDIFQRNVAVTLLLSGSDQRSLFMRDVVIDAIDFPTSDWKWMRLHDVTFRDVQWKSRWVMSECELSSVSFQRCAVENLDVEKSSLVIDGAEMKVASLSLRNESRLDAVFHDGKAESVRVENSRMRVRGSVEIRDGQMENSTIELRPSMGRIALRGCKLRGCAVWVHMGPTDS